VISDLWLTPNAETRGVGSRCGACQFSLAPARFGSHCSEKLGGLGSVSAASSCFCPPPEARRSPRMRGSLVGDGSACSLSRINLCNCSIKREDRASRSAGSPLSWVGNDDWRCSSTSRDLSPWGRDRSPDDADKACSGFRRSVRSSTLVRRLGDDGVDDPGVVTRDRLSSQSSEASLRSA
jgi:hypothetical protein